MTDTPPPDLARLLETAAQISARTGLAINVAPFGAGYRVSIAHGGGEAGRGGGSWDEAFGMLLGIEMATKAQPNTPPPDTTRRDRWRLAIRDVIRRDWADESRWGPLEEGEFEDDATDLMAVADAEYVELHFEAVELEAEQAELRRQLESARRWAIHLEQEVARLEDYRAIDAAITEKADRDCDEHLEAGRALLKWGREWEHCGRRFYLAWQSARRRAAASHKFAKAKGNRIEQYRASRKRWMRAAEADRQTTVDTRARLDAVRDVLDAIDGDVHGKHPIGLAGLRTASARVRAALEDGPAPADGGEVRSPADSWTRVRDSLAAQVDRLLDERDAAAAPGHVKKWPVMPVAQSDLDDWAAVRAATAQRAHADGVHAFCDHDCDPADGQPDDGFTWHTLSACTDEDTCPIHGRNEPIPGPSDDAPADGGEA